MIRVGEINAFSQIEDGELAVFDHTKPRTVKVQFNAPHATVINLVPLNEAGEVPEKPDSVFLARVEGLQTVEFRVHGAFALDAEGLVRYRTVDSDRVHIVIPDAQTFTRIAERRARNPEMERLQQVLMANQERRMQALYMDLAERDKQERKRAERLAKTDDKPKSAASSDKEAPKPDDGTGKPASSAKETGSGKKESDGETNGS